MSLLNFTQASRLIWVKGLKIGQMRPLYVGLIFYVKFFFFVDQVSEVKLVKHSPCLEVWCFWVSFDFIKKNELIFNFGRTLGGLSLMKRSDIGLNFLKQVIKVDTFIKFLLKPLLLHQFFPGLGYCSVIKYTKFTITEEPELLLSQA